MAIDINNLTPANLKAKEVATQDYVDLQVAMYNDGPSSVTVTTKTL